MFFNKSLRDSPINLFDKKNQNSISLSPTWYDVHHIWKKKCRKQASARTSNSTHKKYSHLHFLENSTINLIKFIVCSCIVARYRDCYYYYYYLQVKFGSFLSIFSPFHLSMLNCLFDNFFYSEKKEKSFKQAISYLIHTHTTDDDKEFKNFKDKKNTKNSSCCLPHFEIFKFKNDKKKYKRAQKNWGNV